MIPVHVAADFTSVVVGVRNRHDGRAHNGCGQDNERGAHDGCEIRRYMHRTHPGSRVSIASMRLYVYT